MTLVRMVVSLWGKAKNVPGYLKHPPVEWVGDDMIEAYTSSEGMLILEIHRNKIEVDDAKRELPKLEQELGYVQNQILKINKEIQDGRLGRKGDLSKFETRQTELREEIRIKSSLIEFAVVDRVEFPIEDCE
jgi:hypothetical protein